MWFPTVRSTSEDKTVGAWSLLLPTSLLMVLLLSGCSFGGDDTAEDSTDNGTVGAVDLADLPELASQISPSVVAIETAGGEGSGVIWTSDGTIVTNAHVVQDSEAVAVLFADGSRRDAEVFAVDVLTDLAVVQLVDTEIELPELPVAPELVDVGTPVLAIGNPLGFENSVTFGIVSGVQRSIPDAVGAQSLVDLVQTDAAISPGNSGGALIDLEGNLVGINVAYLPPQSSAVSVGFAIPSPTVIHVVEELLSEGEVRHAFLGVQLAPLEPRSARELPGQAEQGVIVVVVEAGGPADEAGLERGDVITDVDDDPIETVGDLLGVLRRSEPGELLSLEVSRDGETLMLPVVLTDRPVSE